MNQLKVTSMRGISYQKKKEGRGLVNIKEPVLIIFGFNIIACGVAELRGRGSVADLGDLE